MTEAERADELTRLMTAYGDDVKRFCSLTLHDRHLAEDAAQDAFVKAWKALDAFRGECAEKTWLLRIAVNICRDYQRTGWYRHVERRFTHEDAPDSPVSDQPDGELTAAVRALPPKARQMVLLRYYEGLTVRESAHAANISEATAHRRLKRANELLRRALKGWYKDE